MPVKPPSRQNSFKSQASKYDGMSEKQLNKNLEKSVNSTQIDPSRLKNMLEKNVRMTGNKSSRKNNFAAKPLTYKEYREKERELEASHMGPGTHDTSKPFGSDVKMKVTFGAPYKFKPKEGPAPGTYDPDKANKLVKPKI